MWLCLDLGWIWVGFGLGLDSTNNEEYSHLDALANPIQIQSNPNPIGITFNKPSITTRTREAQQVHSHSAFTQCISASTQCISASVHYFIINKSNIACRSQWDKRGGRGKLGDQKLTVYYKGVECNTRFLSPYSTRLSSASFASLPQVSLYELKTNENVYYVDTCTYILH
jgi:hypothetical protein